MNYFKQLLQLLQIEKEEDRKQFELLTQTLPVSARRENGMTWYPVAIRDTEIGRGDYLNLEIERTTHTDLMHQFRFGMTAALFSNHDARNNRIEGVITHISGNRLKLSLRTDELPDWCRQGKLGVDAVFDENSYQEMEKALQLADSLGQKKEVALVPILTGSQPPEFDATAHKWSTPSLNESQQAAVQLMLTARQLAILHGPPGTGKTTTLVQGIKALLQQQKQQILVVAPSNAAVDLLTEKLHTAGCRVVRVGNPARVNEQQLSLTLDQRIAGHNSAKEIKKLRRQAAEYRDMAQKYKRSFGAAEREQRKALFAEARNIMREIERTEQYIADDVLSKAEVITATLVGANHYTIRPLRFGTVVMDEAGQALEPAAWIAVLKGDKLIMAGDHQQLPPTVKAQAAKALSHTLMEKAVQLYPSAVILLQQQYRMHRTIMQFSSNEFYEGRLVADDSVASHLLYAGDAPLLFIDTAGCGYEELAEGNGLSNREEADLLLQHLQQLLEDLQQKEVENLPSVAVISPYRHQVELLKEKLAQQTILQSALQHISVNTIDAFQGQERDVVYISLVRSNADSSIGFLSDIRRMNVAMTRARKKLVVIGDSATLSQFDFYNDFIGYAQTHNGYISAWELM